MYSNWNRDCEQVWVLRILDNSRYLGTRSEHNETQKWYHELCLSFSPLLALRIDFLEWEILDFGTANTKGGKSWSSDCAAGIIGHASR